jgi:hypothetical protein
MDVVDAIGDLMDVVDAIGDICPVDDSTAAVPTLLPKFDACGAAVWLGMWLMPSEVDTVGV